MYSSAAGSVERRLEYIEDWLVQIARNTKDARDLAEGRGGAGAASGKESRDDARFDRFARRVESAVASAVSSRLAQVQGLANRGFGGTVEQARYDYAMEQLGRQFAAVMSPILNGFTYAAVEVERRFRAMNGSQQNGVMGGVVGAGIGARFGGLPGAMLGFAAGSALMGGGSTSGAMMGAAGGAWLGMRSAGPIGALFGGVAGAAAAAPSSYATERPSDYYDRMRREGGSMFGSAFSTGMESLARPFRGPTGGAPPGPGAAPAARRDVTPFSADPLAAGGTADLIQKAIIRATAGADFAEDSPMKPLIDIGIRIIEVLIAIATGSGFTVPVSAVEAR